MGQAIDALEQAYTALAAGDGVCRPRIDIEIPTGSEGKTYRWGSMEGGSAGGYFAIRMKSDIIYETDYSGVRTIEKYCVEPGTFCGLIFLFDTRNGAPLALLNDGHLQHIRVGADSAIGVKHMARGDARVIGMLGSGGMARSHAEAFARVRPIARIQVYSPTPEHRRAYAREMRESLGIEAVAVDTPQAACAGADIVAGCTDAKQPVLYGDWLKPGTHVTCIGGRPDASAFARIDVALRLGDAPAPRGLPEFGFDDEYLTYAVRSGERARRAKRAHGTQLKGRTVRLADLLSGAARGRTSPDQITFSERGNIQGAQFHAVAGKVYEMAAARGLGREIPTSWFLQDIRN
jgi:ornithine cyclodeaminase/alanine dehydrogenase-like protein (mu-crystallin family)